MTVILYHYVHCPFCIRVRMALGYLEMNYKSRVLAYDDEETPLKLTGKKMLPIIDINGKIMNESLDIIQFLDKNRVFRVDEFINSPEFSEFENLLNALGEPIHSLAMPYWIYTPEFTIQSRSYFQKKKEIKRGPFKELVKNKAIYLNKLVPMLNKIETELKPYLNSSSFTLKDILLASHLWGLYVVPEFQFSDKIHNYLQLIKQQCHFDYHKDFWT